ncbi:MAG: glutamine-hydrolyzing GMP synthase, partial [Spirochaetales bacterium]|nr:glutamine-hydrolyzing GMP synthase [Spirochaetales bacterium]
DEVTAIGSGFEIAASTKDCKYAVVQNLSRRMFGIQCHIEVNDTPIGDDIFANFIKLTGMQVNWDQDKVLNTILESVKVQAKDKKVLLFLSGGVDSTVAFALLNKALGQDRVLGLHIDNGFMRQNESKNVCDTYRSFGFTNFIAEDASNVFLNAVVGLTDPQAKRKAVGETFITVRDQVVAKLNLDEDQWMLAQGTLYPDIIESGGSKNAHVIKTHHNRVDGIQKLIAKGLIIEPLKDLYKDEVRVMGKSLGLSDELVYRHPFPGPGISINTLCSDGVWTADDEKNIQSVNEKLAAIDLSKWTDIPAKLYALPVKSVGVQGDFRTYAHPAVLDIDDFIGVKFDWDKAEEISSHITNNVKDVNRTIVKLFDKTDGKAKLLKAYCTKDRLDMIRAVDKIVLDTLYKYDWYRKIFQHLTICLPYATTDGKCSIVLRPVVSEDVMTARFAKLSYKILEEILNLTKKLDFIDAMYYDITNKPPATFGWE